MGLQEKRSVQKIVRLVSLAALTWFAWGSFRSDHVAAAGSCPGVTLVSTQYELSCYGPDQEQEATKDLPFVPINPSAVVMRFTHLELAHIIVARRILPAPSKHANLIAYEYGVIPAEVFNPGTATAISPEWVTVTEVIARKGTPSKLQIRPGGGTGARWNENETLPCRHLAVFIQTGESRKRIKQIGLALQRCACVTTPSHAHQRMR